MAYSVPFTDEANKGRITVEDKSFNEDTSLQLVGKNIADYGEKLNQNFLQMLENFADVNPPRNPVEGQLWYDTTNDVDQLKIYDGTNWVAAGGLKKAATEPEATNSVVGDLWVDTSSSQLYLYTGSGWVLVGPTYSNGNKTGAIPEVIVDISDVNRDIVVNYINNVPVSIISAVEFTPKSPINGFSKIGIGITLSANVSGNTAKVSGESKVAEYFAETPSSTKPLGTISIDQIARLDDVNTHLQKIRLPNSGLEVGNVKTLSLIVEGQSGIIELSQSGTLDVRTPVSTTPVVRIANNGNVGLNNLGPTEVLDLKGNINVGVANGDDAALDTTGKVIVNSEFDSISPNVGALTVKGGAGIAKQLRVGSTITAEGAITVANQSGAIVPPSVTNTSTIGTSSKKFTGVYAETFFGNVSGNVTGNLTGNATGSASKLNSATTFAMSGDITSSGFTFDGQTGGSTKTFTTTLSSSFVNTKPNVSTASPPTVQGTDELLINRSGTLYKATQAQIINSISPIPVGTVTMFAGPTAPAGWFICNGDEVSSSTYGTLASAIGYDASDATTWYWGTPSDPNNLFRIPDYRGRLPVGLGLPGDSNRISNTAAGTLGGVAGNDEATLAVDNLPEHQHDLQSSTGEQFYAVTNATTSAPETLTGGGIDGGTGSRLGLSGGVFDGTSNTPVDITNPFATINFIIYHGVT